MNEPTGPNGWQPIFYACFSRLLRGDPERAAGIREVVRRLLGPAPTRMPSSSRHEWLQVALYGAAGIAGDPELTRMLLEAGADPTDERDGYHGNEVLYHACEFPDPTCAMLVIDAGARQDFVDYDLGRALNFPNPEMIEMFCRHGARATEGHLHQAVWRRRPPRTVAALLDAGAPIDDPDEHGFTPLQIAVRWGEEAVARILRKRGADEAEVTDEDRALGSLPLRKRVVAPTGSRSPLDELLMASVEGGHLEAMRRLLDAGARVDGDPDAEEIPLGHACWRGRGADDPRAGRAGRGAHFRDGGSALGAALHGSRHCTIPREDRRCGTSTRCHKSLTARSCGSCSAAGAKVPERMGENGARTAMLIAELGIDPPA